MWVTQIGFYAHKICWMKETQFLYRPCLGEISNHHYSIMVRYSSLKWWRVVGVALLGGLIFKEKLKVLKGGSWKVENIKEKLKKNCLRRISKRPIIKVILSFISDKTKKIANNQNTTSHIFLSYCRVRFFKHFKIWERLITKENSLYW